MGRHTVHLRGCACPGHAHHEQLTTRDKPLLRSPHGINSQRPAMRDVRIHRKLNSASSAKAGVYDRLVDPARAPTGLCTAAGRRFVTNILFNAYVTVKERSCPLKVGPPCTYWSVRAITFVPRLIATCCCFDMLLRKLLSFWHAVWQA